MAGSFEFKKAANGKFHFNLNASNGEIILQSQMYASRATARTGIASVQAHSPKAERYNKLKAANGKSYFTPRAGNNQVIANSQMYASSASRDAGIASVRANGQTAIITDNS